MSHTDSSTQLTHREVMDSPESALCIHHMLKAQVLKAQAARTPDAVAVAAPERIPLCYKRLFNHIGAAVEQLNAMGIRRNDRVAIVLSNGPEMAVAFLAVSACATAAPLNPAYRANEFDFYLSDLNAKALLVQAGIDSPAREVAEARGILVIELSPLPLAEAGLFTLSGAEQPVSMEWPIGGTGGFAQPDDIAMVLHTSGTTSRPKVVPLTQANICASAHHIRATLEITENDRCLNVMPLFHIHGLMAATLASLAGGASVICTPGFYAPQFFDWIKNCNPTWYTAVPTMHQAIVARATSHRETIEQSSLRLIRSSSSALAPQVMAQLESVFGVPVIESYGMTEASHQMASNPLPPRQRKPGSVGLAAGPKIAIMDESGNFLPAGTTAEIVIRGANVTPGYENNEAANESAFTNGWFRTGDQGYLDEDGYLFITGRLKEIINRGGEKISPREIDEVLIGHPAVLQAVAFAMPHPKLGEDVAAVVVLHEHAYATEKELREYSAGRLADFKVPSRVLFVDEIPKGPTGKLQRIGLAEKLNITPSSQEQLFQIETQVADGGFVAPRTLQEEILAGIWCQVLGVDHVGIHDNFFDSGGDSMMATQLISRVQDATHIGLSLLTFFETPTISGLASWITSKSAPEESDGINRILADLEEISEEEAIRLLADSTQEETEETHDMI
jgi:acyl-CoA synthetase (AMP-forming)/AMP-acid ligase II/acyl carrier protein